VTQTQMSLILGAPLAPRGFETVALDNLGYGLTQVKPGTIPSYDDWVDLVVDFLAFERSRDDRPIVLYGLSAGGMLTYHVAAKAPRGTLRGIVGMTFLDQRKQVVRDQTAHDIVTARAGAPLMHLAAKTPLASLRYPMTLASKMSALANNPAAMKVFLTDRTSAANAQVRPTPPLRTPALAHPSSSSSSSSSSAAANSPGTGGSRCGEVEAGVHVEPEPPVGTDVRPEQRGQSLSVFLRQLVGPHRVAQGRLKQLGVDEDQAPRTRPQAGPAT